MPEMYNTNYVYDNLLGYEKKGVYETIKKMITENESGYRILILGDSVTEQAFYVRPFQNFILGRYGSFIKMINAGVTGYDTDLEYRYLKYRGLDLKPDLVILQFNMNDFSSTPVIIKQKDDSWLALDGNKRLSRWINPVLFANSRFYEFVAVRLLYLSKMKEKEEFRDHVLVTLKSIRNLLDENRIPFYLLVFPQFDDSDSGKRAYNATLDIVKELGLGSRTIDLTIYYSNMSFADISRDPAHPNEEGGRVVAAALAEKLIPFLDGRLNETKNL